MVNRWSRNTASRALTMEFLYIGTAMESRVSRIVMTIINSIKVKPAHEGQRIGLPAPRIGVSIRNVPGNNIAGAGWFRSLLFRLLILVHSSLFTRRLLIRNLMADFFFVLRRSPFRILGPIQRRRLASCIDVKDVLPAE